MLFEQSFPLGTGVCAAVLCKYVLFMICVTWTKMAFFFWKVGILATYMDAHIIDNITFCNGKQSLTACEP